MTAFSRLWKPVTMTSLISAINGSSITTISVRLLTSISTFLYPINDTSNREVPSVTLNLNLPSISAAVPTVVPLIFTVAPGKGSPVFLSKILPETTRTVCWGSCTVFLWMTIWLSTKLYSTPFPFRQKSRIFPISSFVKFTFTVPRWSTSPAL